LKNESLPGFAIIPIPVLVGVGWKLMNENHKLDRGPVAAGGPRVGVPYRIVKEELSGERQKYDKYLRAIRVAGGIAVEVSLRLPEAELNKLADSLDAFVLTGSPADVNPELYGEKLHPLGAAADRDRERTDFALLAHALRANKPLLGICYGIQSMNVFLGGSLFQDVADQVSASITHPWEKSGEGAPEPMHEIAIEPGSKIAALAGAREARVNSSHHQSIDRPGRSLRVAAHSADGVVEAVEYTGDNPWMVGVQWHPERMAEHGLSKALFRELVAAARGAATRA
jgi:putative glutamine amidotransferase